MRRHQLVSLAGILVAGCSTALPEGVMGPDADALARKMEAAVKAEAWRSSGAVTWVFGGRNTHLWDRDRGFALVESGSDRAMVDLGRRRGRAWKAGVELTGEDARSAVDAAYADWVNDSFWLNPVVKTFDPGVVRKIVPNFDDRGNALLVQYTSGGRTPGDAYLWILDDAGRPTAWKMWTSIIPIGGIEISWQGWQELETGAVVSTLHETPVFDLELTEVHAARDLPTLRPGDDAFAPLLECETTPELCAEL